ncbi:MAG: response regulator [Thermanaerothrix sp.]|nr:response regulator [Thermanaerothrix sp.]
MYAISRVRPRVYVVDDSIMNLQILEEVLRIQGYEVRTFPNPLEALSEADQEPPDLFILDVVLPEMDGFELCRRLKQREILREIPVMFVSSLDDPQHISKAFLEGGVDYVPKPFRPEEIAARARTHIRLREAQRELLEQNRELEGILQRKDQEVMRAQLATIEALSELAESRDETTGGHIIRTSHYCALLGRGLMELGLYRDQVDHDFIELLKKAAPLHDIGKVGIPDSILLKRAPLTPEEYDAMKNHTIMGEQALLKVLKKYPGHPLLQMGIQIARSHHEKWDGTGYPDGLKGEEIPLAARIMAVADVYDALRCYRPYKTPLSHEESLFIIEEGSGDHFDPSVVEAFMAMETAFKTTSEKLVFPEEMEVPGP